MLPIPMTDSNTVRKLLRYAGPSDLVDIQDLAATDVKFRDQVKAILSVERINGDYLPQLIISTS